MNSLYSSGDAQRRKSHRRSDSVDLEPNNRRSTSTESTLSLYKISSLYTPPDSPTALQGDQGSRRRNDSSKSFCQVSVIDLDLVTEECARFQQRLNSQGRRKTTPVGASPKWWEESIEEDVETRYSRLDEALPSEDDGCDKSPLSPKTTNANIDAHCNGKLPHSSLELLEHYSKKAKDTTIIDNNKQLGPRVLREFEALKI